MKKAVLFLVIALGLQLGAKELKVLAIGNSFSVCVRHNLPQMVASVPGCRLILTSASIGGCSLERHCREWAKAEKDPAYKPYGVCVVDSANIPKDISFRRGSVNELVKSEKYDIITIQQNSANSWKYATYQPYARNLIAILKKYQPQAEIVIQQTWSYRCDARAFQKWGIDNSTMFKKLEAAYARLAKENGFRIIPTGYAIQIFRAETPVKFVPVNPAELKNFKRPAVPGHDGEVVGKYVWKRPRKSKNGPVQLTLDANHLNPDGQYLQAAVWFNFLFDRPATEVRYVMRGMKPEYAKFLLNCAHKAVSTCKQPGK